ncbi:MAG: hypothetical protein AAF250_08350 [Pseudomonadota bacterium]
MAEKPSQNDAEILQLIASLSSVSLPESTEISEEERPEKVLEWLLNEALLVLQKCDRLYLLINGEEIRPKFVEILRKRMLPDGRRSVALDEERSSMLNIFYREKIGLREGEGEYTLQKAAELVGLLEQNDNEDPTGAVMQSYKRYKRVLRDHYLITFDEAEERFRVQDARSARLPNLPAAGGRPKKHDK